MIKSETLSMIFKEPDLSTIPMSPVRCQPELAIVGPLMTTSPESSSFQLTESKLSLSLTTATSKSGIAIPARARSCGDLWQMDESIVVQTLPHASVHP